MLLDDVTALYSGSTPITAIYNGATEIWSATPTVDLFAFTAVDDTPTITSAALGASAVPTIAGSPGWLREKRTGVAENAAGGAQSSTATLDVAGSTRFRYVGVYSAAGHAANAGNYVLADFKAGGSTSNARWPFTPKFTTSSPNVELRLRAPVANPAIGRIKVNGLYVQEATHTATAAAGAGLSVKLTFPSAKARTIEFISLMQAEGDFGGVAVDAGYTVTKPAEGTKRIAFLGDSYVNGAGSYPTGAGNTHTFIWRLATLMGGDEVINAGIGGTGFNAIVVDQPTSNFAGRVAAVMAMDPDVVVVVGGRNEANDTGLQASVESLLDAIGSGVQRYVLRTSADTATTVNAAISAGAASRGIPFLSVPLDAYPKIDAVHLTYAAHQDFANAAFALM